MGGACGRDIEGGRLVWRTQETPIGSVVIVADSAGVSALEFLDERSGPEAAARVGSVLGVSSEPGETAAMVAMMGELEEYFGGKRTVFEAAPRLHGTEFQRRVWDALVRIPAGETRSYAEIAREVGSPGAVRAVGRTNGMNPVAIIVPCHRVIGADGSLTGFGGGLWRKRWLLDHEARMTGRVVGGQLMLAE